MSTENLTNLNIEAALKLLKAFSCIETHTIDTESAKVELRQALLTIVDLSDTQNLGICAENAAEGFTALASYLQALGYKPPFDTADIPSTDDPVYIKFNTQRMSHYLDSYTGKYRGVLVSCQSSDYDEINGTYGHFPLDLFAE